MKRISAIIAASALLLVFACKKTKDAPPENTPGPPTQTGDLHVIVKTYDSLGNERSEHGGVRVLLQSGTSATTSADGRVTFTGMPYGVYSPALLKPGYDGAPESVNLAFASQTLTLPFAQASPFVLRDQAALFKHKGTLRLQFRLEPELPETHHLKIAVMASTQQGMTPSNYSVVDIMGVTTNSLTSYNVAKLPNLSAFLTQLDSGASFYISSLPVSYGTIVTNFSTRTYLLGKSQYYPGSILLIKNWK